VTVCPHTHKQCGCQPDEGTFCSHEYVAELQARAVLRTFVSDDFTGLWSVGTAAVVIAVDEEAARVLLDAECRKHGLSGFDGTLREFPAVAHAVVICDGNY
jgi:hypothetical protein